jgi:hypothetical protein
MVTNPSPRQDHYLGRVTDTLTQKKSTDTVAALGACH